jgi:hypothetical protein
MEKKRKRPSSPPGGPAAINGVVYQLLWSLLAVAKGMVTGQRGVHDGVIDELVVVLEPIGGGGDLVLDTGRRWAVEQVKARSTGAPWSLREVINSVIPDLYLASDRAPPGSVYRFVTEGVMGDWSDVYGLFRSLRERIESADSPYAVLDDVTELDLQGRLTLREGTSGAQGESTLTEKTLIDHIVEIVRDRPAIALREDLATTRDRLVRMLAGFEFVGGRSTDLVTHEIDTILLDIVDAGEDIPTIRDALAMSLARLAARGDAKICSADFLKTHRLEAVPLGEWALLRSNATDLLQRNLAENQYEPARNVRSASAQKLVEQWQPGFPCLMVSGESGRGKSWHVLAMAQAAALGRGLVAVIKATGDAHRTLDAAARKVWSDIGKHDHIIPLDRIAERIQARVPAVAGCWLTLVIDNLSDIDEARILALNNWSRLGIRVILACSPRASAELRDLNSPAIAECAVGDFTAGELHEYMSRCLPELNWAAVPEYLRKPLQRPLLADIYRQIAGQQMWDPQSEYNVYSRFWTRLVSGRPLIEVVVNELARSVLAGRSYPFHTSDVAATGGVAEATDYLESRGWFRHSIDSSGVRFEFAHERLLDWAVANALVDDLRQHRHSMESLGDLFGRIIDGRSPVPGRELGYVPMDTLWLLTQDRALCGQLGDLLKQIETAFIRIEVVYERLIPTLGEPILPVLLDRLRATATDMYLNGRIVTALAALGPTAALTAVQSLLPDSHPLLQRAAMRLLTSRPCPGHLDRLWQLHCSGAAAPQAFLRPNEQDYQVYDDSFGALRECVALEPGWLDAAIERPLDSRAPVHDLVYLLSSLHGPVARGLWRNHRDRLIAHVSPQKLRSIATCIAYHGDMDDVPWLLAQLSNEETLTGPCAMKALARIAPDVAIAHFDRLPDRGFFTTDNWYADRLFAWNPDAMRAKLFAMMQARSDAWTTAAVYEHREQYVDEATCSLLLDRIEDELADVLAREDWGRSEPLMIPLRFLAGMTASATLPAFAAKNGSLLEQRLRDMALRIGPRQGLERDSMVRTELLAILLRIGGSGFTEVVNAYLASPSVLALLDTVELAAKRPDEATIRLLTRLTEAKEKPYTDYSIPGRAAAILAERGYWQPALDLMERSGFDVKRVSDLADYNLRPPSRLLDPLRNRVTKLRELSPAGALIAIGFGDSLADAKLICDVLAAAPPESDQAQACAIALRMLARHPKSAISLLQPLLKHHQFPAINALLRNRTKPALDVLRAHRLEEFDAVVYGLLLNRHPDARAIADEARKYIEDRTLRQWLGSRHLNSELARLVQRVRDKSLIDAILESPQIREYLRSEAFADEGNFWYTGSKVAAIRALSAIDSEAAFTAAETAFANARNHDRERYPHLLTVLDPVRAVGVLLHQMEHEEKESVVVAIGIALQQCPVDRILYDRLVSGDAGDTLAACRSAGWASLSDRVADELKRMLTGDDDDLAAEAAAALGRMARRRDFLALCDQFVAEPDANRKWLLLDCLLAMGEPGPAHLSWPHEGPPLGNYVTPGQRCYVTDKLKKRRDELALHRK